jgi:hypothetical protein
MLLCPLTREETKVPQEIDLTKLSTEELDDLLVRAAKHRASLQPAPPTEHPKPTDVVVNPGWYTALIDSGTLLQVRHPGFGWLSFLIPANERAHLLSLFLRQALFVPEKGAANAPPGSAGGAVH